MEKGIVRVPEWAKEAFRNGAYLIAIGGVKVFTDKADLDGSEVVKHTWWGLKNEPTVIFPGSWIEIQEPEIDWDRTKKDSPIRVAIDGRWVNYHYSHFEEGNVWVYGNGCTSHTAPPKTRQIKFDPEIRSIEFLEGVNPEDWYE